MNESLQVFWRERSARERALICVAAAAIAVGIAFSYLWLPVTRERGRLVIRVAELRAQAQAMNRDVHELERLRAAARTAPELKSAIQKLGPATTSTPPEIVLQDPATARVTIASLQADQALTWFARLQSESGARLESARMTALGSQEYVKVEAIWGARQ
jgi:type II secretory pathway component PulM